MKLFLFLLFCGCAFAQWDPNFQKSRSAIVHLFEWHWDTIADECERFLGPAGYAGVQISPPNENRVIEGRPWWERYQPVSYILTTRSGDMQSLSNMIDRCRASGIEIYADVVINHMTEFGVNGTGTAGSPFDSSRGFFPSVPYSMYDTNDVNCGTSSGLIEDMLSVDQIKDCQLLGLTDLNQGKDYVRSKIIEYMNELISLGVAGFRVDAAKYMWPEDLDFIFESLNNLSTSKGFEPGQRAFIYQEVIEVQGEPVTASEYFNTGRITEFNYGLNLAKFKDSLYLLENFGEDWNMVPKQNALVFLSNHDNQRGHGGGGDVITFEDAYNLKIFNAFMMAWPYGVKRIMSSYYFKTSNDGPPALQRSAESQETCDNGWVCEHRWPQIKNMMAFSSAAKGENVKNWWSDSKNQIAFSRGSKAFLAINKSGYEMNETLQTGLAKGKYCNVITSDFINNKCTGACVDVDDNGFALINIPDGSDPVVALHVNAMC